MMGQCNKKLFVISLILILCIALPNVILAKEGISGYEGGISSGEAPGKPAYEYQEICFITGVPITLKGTVLIRKTYKKDSIITTYTYSLRNNDRSATLNRVLVYNTKLTTSDNGQTIEETVLNTTPIEVIKIGDNTYTLKSYDFSRTNIIDPKPAVNYYAGNISGRKQYQIGDGTSKSTVTIDVSGDFYGYDLYWGSTEIKTIEYIIQSENRTDTISDRWGGTASISLSASSTKQLKYHENEPEQISFEGGFVQIQNNVSVLEYAISMPEFDSKGISTDNIMEYRSNLMLQTFPTQTRLPVPALSHLRGHWAENDVKTLYSLEIFKGNEQYFDPSEYMTRAQFASAVVKAAREMPLDQASSSNTTTRTSSRSRTAPKIKSPFSDVSEQYYLFTDIYNAHKRGIMKGMNDGKFDPEGYITIADAVATFIRATGLENLAPNNAVTTFRDNDQIPQYARKAVYAAKMIGLVNGDEYGYLKPNEYLTKGRAAAMINRLVKYMREDIRKDYSEHIIDF